MASPSRRPPPVLLPHPGPNRSTKQAAHETWKETRPPVLGTVPQTKDGESMAPRGGSQRGSGRGAPVASRREADLSDILTVSQKDELVLLATSVTDAMLQHIGQIFDPPTEPLLNSVPVNIVVKNGLNKSTGRSFNSGQSNTANGGVKEVEGVQAELRKEAMAAFRKWQASVIKRFTDISAAKAQLLNKPQQHGKIRNGKSLSRQSERGGGSIRSAAGVSRQGSRGGPMTSGENSRPSGAAVSSAVHLAGSTAVPSPKLAQFSMEKRQLLLHAIVLLLLSLESYTAYSRVFFLRMASQLRVPAHVIARDETRVARGLSRAAHSVYSDTGLLKTEDARKEKRGKGGSSAAINITGLAAPLLDVRIGSVASGKGLGSTTVASVLGTLGTLADGGLAACMFFGICGPRGTPAKTLDAFTRDIQDTSLLPLRAMKNTEAIEGNKIPPDDRRLRLSIGISGWMSQKEDIGNPWRVLGDNSESYVLGWEDETLSKVGSSLEIMAMSTAWQNAKKEFADRNVFDSLKAFAWPEGLLKISKIVDNPWSLGMVRADKVGQALADAIANKVQGERGVSLLGYGLGARVIYTCLMSLSERRAFGLVENVIMIGTPAPSAACVWTALRSAAFGRVINVFSENDSMLGFLHRTGCVQFGVAGLQRIQNVYGIENVDATKPVVSHLRYSQLVGRILKDVNWEDLDMEEIARSEKSLALAEKEQKGETNKQNGGPASKNSRRWGKEGRRRTGKKKLEEQFQALNISQ